MAVTIELPDDVEKRLRAQSPETMRVGGKYLLGQFERFQRYLPWRFVCLHSASSIEQMRVVLLNMRPSASVFYKAIPDPLEFLRSPMALAAPEKDRGG